MESWYDDMDDTVLNLLVPFLKEIVIEKVDVRELLTEKIKQEILYRNLDEAKNIPSIEEMR